MRDYGKVFSRIWESPDFRALTEDGRTLALYLLTCQHGTIAGVFRVPDGYASEDLQWTAERVSEGFRNLTAKGFATRCEVTKWVWITNFLAWNPPENPNQRKAAAKVAAGVPDSCVWKAVFLLKHGILFGLESPAKENPSVTLPEPLPNQYQEQEQEQKGEASPKAPTAKALAKDWVLPDDWRQWALQERPDLNPDKVAERFGDYWRAKGGKDGRKLDWQATWRNWVRDQRSTDAIRRTDQGLGAFV